MLKVKIKSISYQHVLSVEKFDWILSHLDTPLRISCLDFDDAGNIQYLVIRADDIPGDVIVLFIDSNDVTYEFVGDWPARTNRR